MKVLICAKIAQQVFGYHLKPVHSKCLYGSGTQTPSTPTPRRRLAVLRRLARNLASRLDSGPALLHGNGGPSRTLNRFVGATELSLAATDGFRDGKCGEDERNTSGHVHKENPAPAKRIGNVAADDKAGGQSNARTGSPNGEGSCPFIGTSLLSRESIGRHRYWASMIGLCQGKAEVSPRHWHLDCARSVRLRQEKPV
jgi:hypothetical protein